ncbi:hypothetical protein HMPREF0063_11910 [Aeromicrobium marinum DSM 15272]|uniref:Uncharacterized protein n=1 Tax=Aeromicrobium marinum DSM 15272 TaxID=585531 RepID=E2SDX4_9ACTN|nr:hypothetical protein [Aeromicrobium marinum]EFQ82701.1 hypothetical protein HMPREF0063_11910 [Aeromicrobium marinum DSM 15272]
MTTTPSIRDEFASSFDDWIAGATVSKRSVVIYGKAGLYATYQQLERDLAIATAVESPGESMGGSEASRIRKDLQAVYDEWMESKSTWVVRAVSDADWDAVRAGDESEDLAPLVEPEKMEKPVEPVLPEKPTEAQKKSHTVAVRKYAKALAAYEAKVPAYREEIAAYLDELNLRLIRRVVVSVTIGSGATRTADGDVPVVTIAQLRALRAQIGEKQFTGLLNAAQQATSEEPVIPAPFSPSTSEDDPT